MAAEPETGLVISYQFLWSREHERGFELVRKARPSCVVVPLTRGKGDVVLFPLTTQPPGPERLAIRVPETERRRLKLRGDTPCWIILDECNMDILPGSMHLEPIGREPSAFVHGKFSHAFMRQMLGALAQAVRSRIMKVVPRDI